MKISWVILTHNREDVVKKCFRHNYLNCGINHRNLEIITVDNGSFPYFGDKNPPQLFAEISILNRENLGVAKGYNRGLAMATGDYIVITGCDRIMPEGWLKTWLEYMEKIPHTGIISCYSKTNDKVPERIHGNRTIMIGSAVSYTRAIPMEARILSRDLFRKIGYFHEGLGLYAWEDILWSERAEKVTKELGLINYIIPGMVAEHLGDEGCDEYTGIDPKSYHDFKRKESQDPAKQKVCEEYRAAGHPYINPYGK